MESGTLWDQQVPGCFGVQSFVFADHFLEEQQAFIWLEDLRQRQVGWAIARGQVRAFLMAQGALPPHITKQLRKAARMMAPWLGP